jgi:Ca2+/Na+ antiporter
MEQSPVPADASVGPAPAVHHLSDRASSAAGSSTESFRSLRGLSTALTWLLAASTLACLAQLGALIDRIRVANRIDAATSFRAFVKAVAAGVHADREVAAIGGITFLLGLAVFVVLIVYLHRAARNTRIWDATPQRWGPGWAIGGWFVPLANLAIPGLLVGETWRRTPEAGNDRARPSNALIWTWWALWVGGVLALRAHRNPGSLDALRAADTTRAVACAALALSCVLLIVIVRRLAGRQARLTT